jgi:hypothetical protein
MKNLLLIYFIFSVGYINAQQDTCILNIDYSIDNYNDRDYFEYTDFDEVFLEFMSKKPIKRVQFAKKHILAYGIPEAMNAISGYNIDPLSYLDHEWAGNKIENKKLLRKTVKLWRKGIKSKFYLKNKSVLKEKFYNNKADNILASRYFYSSIFFYFTDCNSCDKIHILICSLNYKDIDKRVIEIFKTDLDTLSSQKTPEFYTDGVVNHEKLQEAIRLWREVLCE